MNIFHAQFSAGQVVQATGVPNPTLQSWLKRDLIVAQQGGGASGLHRRFSFFNTMEIASAKALLDAGMGDLKHVFKAAREFAHFAEGDRLAGLPFPITSKNTLTMIAARGDRSTVLLWESGTDMLPIIWHELGSRDGFVIVTADFVFNRVVTALGFDPAAVMADAYNS